MELSIAAEVREDLGKQKSSQLRRNGQIPAVLYGEGKPVEHLMVNAHDFKRMILKNGTGRLISLDLQKGKKAIKEQVLIKECQRHPLKGNVLHIDFFRVAMDHPVTLKTPVHMTGEDKRARDGAILELLIHELEISCLPANIPDRILIDVSKLTIGAGIHVKDLVVAEGIRILTPMDEVVVLASAPAVVVEPTPTTEATTEPEVIGTKKPEE
jgi:large subunit ribosomal protein L25